MARDYYSVRTGRRSGASALTLDTFKSLFRSEISQLDARDYLQEAFGKYCVDADGGLIPGTLGSDIPARVMLSVRKEGLWPVWDNALNYSEDDLFDMIEFMYDHISKPLEEGATYHNYAGCGYHYTRFDRVEGQREYREAINLLLRDYGAGFELNDAGEVLETAPEGMESLLEAPLPTSDATVTGRYRSAITQFRKRGATVDERRIAVRELADVLEHLRSDVQSVLTKADDGDLFNLANNFGIRHLNAKQRTGYDQSVWLSWMFYFYLATIHASVRLLEGKARP